MNMVALRKRVEERLGLLSLSSVSSDAEENRGTLVKTIRKPRGVDNAPFRKGPLGLHRARFRDGDAFLRHSRNLELQIRASIRSEGRIDVIIEIDLIQTPCVTIKQHLQACLDDVGSLRLR